jgi:hypothetical protein
MKMVKIRVTNWRCIEDLELELARINIFVGPNSAGKSSLAYAIYFASKSRSHDPQTLLFQLYGYGPDMVARRVNGKPRFPVSIKIDDSELIVELREGKPAVMKRSQASPWAGEFLLPSRRVGYFQVIRLLQKISEIARGSVQGADLGVLAAFIGKFLEQLFREFSLPLRT